MDNYVKTCEAKCRHRLEKKEEYKKGTIFQLEEVPFLITAKLGYGFITRQISPLKCSSQPSLCFCLHTGDCGENRSYYTQCLAEVVLDRQHILPSVNERFRHT